MYDEIDMHIPRSEVVEGGVYITEPDQLRKVTKIENDKVHYLAAGANTNHPWNWGHPKSSPPSIDTFARAVERKLTDEEFKALVGNRPEPKAKSNVFPGFSRIYAHHH